MRVSLSATRTGLWCSAVWMLALSGAWGAQVPVQPPPVAATPHAAEFSHVMSAASDAYVDNHFDIAARLFQRAVALDPASDQAQFWAGQALVYGRRPAAAISYLESAHRLGIDSVALHLALVSAYAGAGRSVERDRERALLHTWHDQPKEHPSIARQGGFLVETIYVRGWHVNVMEYLKPVKIEGQTDRDLLWRFTVRDPAEMVERTFFVERTPQGCDLISQSGAGEFLPGAERVLHYPQAPTYDEARAQVLRRLHFHLTN